MHIRDLFLKIILFLLLLSSVSIANETQKVFEVSYDPDYAPYSYKIDGKPYGLLIDIFEKWAIVNDYKVEFIDGKSWDGAIELAKNGKVDFFLGTEPYDDWMKSSLPYYKTKTSLFTLKTLTTIPKSIGIVGEDYKEDILKEFKNVKVLSYLTYDKLLNALVNKKVEAIYDDSVALDYFIIKKNKMHLIVKLKLLSKNSSICAISNSRKNADIFDKGFLKIPKNDLIEIEKKWIFDSSQRYYETLDNKKSIFTKEEQIWIEKHPIIRLAAMSYWPKDNNGNALHKEILKLINKYSGLNIVPVEYKAWSLGYNAAIKGDDVMGIMGLSHTPEREKNHFYYTQAYDFSPSYLITREDESKINSFDDIKDKKIYIKKNSIVELMIRAKSPTTKIIPLLTLDDIYKKLLSSKEADGAIAYYIDKDDLKKYHLKIVEKIYDRYGEVAIGINHRYPLLASIINKAYEAIPKLELAQARDRKYKKSINSLKLSEKINVSYKELLSKEEIAFAVFIFLMFGYLAYKLYSRSKILDINLSTFSILAIFFELIMITFLTYEIITLDRTENLLAKSYKNRLNMIKAVYKLRQSSDDLTNFARAYAITGDKKFKKRYFETLEIRNGTKKRPKGYSGIYWDLSDTMRELRHPLEKKLSFKDITKSLPLNSFELSKIRESEVNSNSLVNMEKRAFKAVEENNKQLATMLLYSDKYYKGKEKIMLPLDDLTTELDARTKKEIGFLEKKIKAQFLYILIMGVLFLLGNIIVYFLMRKKINEPIDYITSVIKRLQNGEKDIVQKEFYNDEIGDMNREFFRMKNIIEEQQKNLNSKIIELNQTKKEIEDIHKHTKESIKYASFIQGALLADNNKFKKYFSDYFAIWHPKDIVGGDIYLFDELRSDDECLLMVIDCTGHGVPGAFVTMLVKAIERQVIADILNSDKAVSPAEILSTFNKYIKQLLKQEGKESISNAGFDGGIIYYNKKEKVIKFAGAETPLFYIEDNELKVIKGSRHSVGYKKSDKNFEFKEHAISIKEGMEFYCSTDGYFDQIGGEKGFPFGKKRFKEIIKEYHSEPMSEQQEIFLYKLYEYENMIKDNERNDDITLIGFRI